MMKINSKWEGAFFPTKWVKVTQDKLFSIFKSKHILRVWMFAHRNLYSCIYLIILRSERTKELQFLKPFSALRTFLKFPLWKWRIFNSVLIFSKHILYPKLKREHSPSAYHDASIVIWTHYSFIFFTSDFDGWYNFKKYFQ